MIRTSLAALAALLLLSACEHTQSPETTTNNESKPALSAGDQKQIDEAMPHAYTSPVGQPVNWANPESGDSGSIVAVKDGYSQQGAYCREFQKTVTSGGQTAKTTSDFCQMPDGSWKAVPSQR